MSEGEGKYIPMILVLGWWSLASYNLVIRLKPMLLWENSVFRGVTQINVTVISKGGSLEI